MNKENQASSLTCILRFTEDMELIFFYQELLYIWRGTPGDIPDVYATKLLSTYLISTRFVKQIISWDC